MKTTIYITEDQSSIEGAIPDPSWIAGGERVCTLRLHELELRMTTAQAAALDDALRRWLFAGGEVDINDPDYRSVEEHDGLRKIVKALCKGELRSVSYGSAEIPESLRRVVRGAVYELSKRDVEAWTTIEEDLREAKQRIAEFEQELADVRRDAGPSRTRPRAKAER